VRAVLACLLLLTAAALCRADPPRRPPQAPPCRHAPRPPQAPPCRHHDPAPAPPRTEADYWRADGWQRDSDGQWFRWTPDTHVAPAYHTPAYYPQPAPQFYGPVGRFGGGGGRFFGGGGRGGGC
jgi:hypothetical protein